MPRSAREAPGGMVFHVLNRGVRRMRLFEKDGKHASSTGAAAEVGEEEAGRLSTERGGREVRLKNRLKNEPVPFSGPKKRKPKN